MGCVRFDTRARRETWQTFHGRLYEPHELRMPVGPGDEFRQDRTRSQFVAAFDLTEYHQRLRLTFLRLASWLEPELRASGRAVMWSDNPAYDFMWVADGFARALGQCPFGHSARRIGDLYAGLSGEPSNTQRWKALRHPIPHDHDPVHDALGNAWALVRMLRGERA